MPVSSRDLSRAARLLRVRSLREATGLFAGNYASAFRGGGLEFEESRPYAPGDDVRQIDWNATARTGEPHVKRFREERNQTLLFVLDVSASMRFGTAHRSKADTAAHAVALLAAAAGRAGDRCGLVAFDAGLRAEVAVARGVAHTWRIIAAAVETAGRSAGGTDLAAALARVDALTRRRAVVVVVSDFRGSSAAGGGPGLRVPLGRIARRHDLVAAAVSDPREEALLPAGPVRVADPEHPGRARLVFSGSRRVRARYAAEAARFRTSLERELRGAGGQPVWLRTDASPLHALGRFFHERAARRLRAVA